MAEHPKLLLIIAQSGRMLAQSAAREGYTVRVADCFGDIDTLAVADKYLKLPTLDNISKEQVLQALITLSDEQPSLLICGTGVERFYPFLSHLPNHIKFAGSSFVSFEQICDPVKWIALLDKLALPFPATKFDSTQTLKGKWLAKSAGAWGGTHIIDANLIDQQKGFYYQQQIEGISGSVLFLANRHDFRVLLFNQQFNLNLASNDFSLKAIASGLLLDNKQQQVIYNALQKLTHQLALSGLMSLDFMLDTAGNIFLLEINARPTASCQLLPAHLPIIDWQKMCSAGVIPAVATELPTKKRILWFCFAPERMVIPSGFNWPAYCYDLPEEGSIIDKGAIICSLLLEQNPDAEDTEIHGHYFENKLIENLSVPA